MKKSFWSAVFLYRVVLLFIFTPAGQIHAQTANSYSISGRVFDVETERPIANANAFLAHTMLGDAGDAEGIFRISKIPAGQYELIVSVVGYEIFKKTIRLPADMPVTVMVALRPTVIQFPEVEISADSKEWQKNLRRFTEQFLGTSRNAMMTTIENPYALDFSVKNDTLYALAHEPLRITNRGLGYKIFYVLESFQTSGTTVRFAGTPRFDTLAAETPEQMRVWQQRRQQAYLGSLRHFLTVLCANYDSVRSVLQRDPTLAEPLSAGANLVSRSGFMIYRRFRPVGSPHLVRRLVAPFSLIHAGEHPDDRILSFRGSLQVVYNREAEEPEYLTYLRLDRWVHTYQTSLIDALQDSVTIDVRGRYFDAFALHTRGYWGWERLAEMLPFEYSLPMPQN